MIGLNARDLLGRRVHMPWAIVPSGSMVELPDGSTFVTDTPGPGPDAPAIVLLHAVGCTGLLTWYPAIEALARRYRVVTLDQRWHGRGIQSPTFDLHDCADDVAALMDALSIEEAMIGGFSMGSIIAQRVWRQHPHRVSGLVLAATTDRFRQSASERLFHQGVELAMAGARGVSRSRTLRRAAQAAADTVVEVPDEMKDWALDEWRSTSPWAVGQAVAALGRHHSRPWLSSIDVPTAVVVPPHDHVIPPKRQLAVARAIPGATIHDIPAGHACCVLEAEVFVPAFVEAVNTVNARAAGFPG
jgi:pimeloyl-ACP methyl ester carboxylesterase